jgi:hypothetical protein
MTSRRLQLVFVVKGYKFHEFYTRGKLRLLDFKNPHGM